MSTSTYTILPENGDFANIGIYPALLISEASNVSQAARHQIRVVVIRPIQSFSVQNGRWLLCARRHIFRAWMLGNTRDLIRNKSTREELEVKRYFFFTGSLRPSR